MQAAIAIMHMNTVMNQACPRSDGARTSAKPIADAVGGFDVAMMMR
jgi:hypothetical protein